MWLDFFKQKYSFCLQEAMTRPSCSDMLLSLSFTFIINTDNLGISCVKA